MKDALKLIPTQAARLLDIRAEDISARPWNEEAGDLLPPARLPAEGALSSRGRVFRPDLVLDTGWLKLVTVWRSTGGAAGILLAVRHLTRHWSTGTVPLLAVPFMGETGRRLCAAEGVSWLDLSGNASLTGPGLKVKVEGRPNRYQRRGRPGSVFAPRSARVARLLLVHPQRVFIQKEIVSETALDAGFVSRIVGQLEQAGLVVREGRRLRCPGLGDLLTAWRDAADMAPRRVISGRVDVVEAEGSVARQVAAALAGLGVDHAATGTAAAQLLAGRAGQDREQGPAVFYLRQEPEMGLLEKLGFRETEGEGNLQLAVPKDEGVFAGAADVQGVRCVHPVQAWVDLKGAAGSGEELGRLVRERCLGF